MIAASSDQGRVHAASAWVEFDRGAVARTVGEPTHRAVDQTAFGATSSTSRTLERLS
jgi:hypothetical protein